MLTSFTPGRILPTMTTESPTFRPGALCKFRETCSNLGHCQLATTLNHEIVTGAKSTVQNELNKESCNHATLILARHAAQRRLKEPIEQNSNQNLLR